MDVTVDSESGNSTKQVGKTFWKANPIMKNVFTCLGLYLLMWDKDKEEYKIRKKRFILSYIFWFLWPMVGILLAYFGSVILGIESGITENLQGEAFVISIPLYILLLGFIPANQTYALSIFSKKLPSILEEISRLSDKAGNILCTFRHDKEINVNLLKRYDSDNDDNANVSICERLTDKLQKWLPETTFTIALLAFISSTIYSIVELTSKGSVFEEWYFIVMMGFYLVMPVFTSWFCMIFIEWQRKVYERISNKINEEIYIKKEKDFKEPENTERDLKALNIYCDKIQDIFILLNEGVFNYPLGVNMLVYIATSTFCTSRILSNPEYIYYVFPLTVSAGHIAIICARCCNLLDEHGNVISTLKDIQQTRMKQALLQSQPNDESISNLLDSLQKNLLESPPKVEILGSAFTVDYAMLSTIFGFVLSYALVINEVFEDNTPVCNFINPSNTMSNTSTEPITTSTIDPETPSSLSDGVIAGIVIGSIAGVALIIGSVTYCYTRKKLCCR